MVSAECPAVGSSPATSGSTSCVSCDSVSLQDSAGAGGPLAKLPGLSQHDHVLYRGPGSLPGQRDHQLPHSHLLVHAAGEEAFHLCTS